MPVARRSPIFVQLGIVAAALVAFAAVPPRHGRMLLVPLDGGTGIAVRLAVARGAALVGRGPLPGSVVVVGDRARLAGPLRARGIMTLAAPPGGCGAGASETEA